LKAIPLLAFLLAAQPAAALACSIPPSTLSVEEEIDLPADSLARLDRLGLGPDR
jgi:hypothetical protein